MHNLCFGVPVNQYKIIKNVISLLPSFVKIFSWKNIKDDSVGTFFLRFATSIILLIVQNEHI